MVDTRCAMTFKSDVVTAIELGGRKAFVRALNLTLRRFGEFRPLSTHKEIRKEQAGHASWARQNSSMSSGLSSQVVAKKYHEWGEPCEPEKRMKPSPEMFEQMLLMLKKRIVSPTSKEGKRHLRESRTDQTSFTKVGVNGWSSVVSK